MVFQIRFLLFLWQDVTRDGEYNPRSEEYEGIKQFLVLSLYFFFYKDVNAISYQIYYFYKTCR
jgi:hypothetical protein